MLWFPLAGVLKLNMTLSLSWRNFGIHRGFWDSQATPSMVIFGSFRDRYDTTKGIAENRRHDGADGVGAFWE
jgi:hypothetical protein